MASNTPTHSKPERPRDAPRGGAPLGRGGAKQPGPRVERLLQILMGALATLGTLLLGMGQQNLLLPVFMLLAVVTSVVVTDILGRFRLPRGIANLAAVIAVGFSLTEFFFREDDTHRQLLAIAHLLICLQVVLLFQLKSDRIYWQLAVLSLLQVVVAAALNVGFEFGVVLVVFCVVALLALAVFFVHRTSSRFPDRTTDRSGMRTARGPARDAGSQPRSKTSTFASLLGGPPRAEPLMGAEAISRELLGWGFVRHVLGLGLATIIFTTVFFYCTPRTVSSNRPSRGGGQVVGFSNEVELNEIGKLATSRELVMRVHFSDLATREAYPLFGEPYFRGMVLNDYVTKGPRPKWRSGSAPISRPPRPLPAIERREEGLVLQDILLQPRSKGLLFSVAPARQPPSAGVRQDVIYDPQTEQLFRGASEGLKLRVPFRYVIATDAFRDGVQQSFRLRYWDPKRRDTDKFGLDLANRALLADFNPTRFPRLAALAAEIVDKSATSDPLAKARLLQNHFRNTKRYRYTLDFRNLSRTPNVDPIEDFVANHRSGHCEYFASALAMMLRSQGIPSRLVVGYKGGEFNQVGGYYQVRQSSAHAWVEAFIDPRYLPESVRQQAGDRLAGAWVRLDPTPGVSSGLQGEQEGSIIRRVGQALDYAQLLWSDYVLGLTPERQKQAGLQPFVSGGSNAASRTWNFAAWRLRDWFSWRAGLAAMTLAALLLLAYRVLSSLWGRLAWPRRVAQQRRSRSRVRVDFYERLERILKKCGLQREPQQTQREFVVVAARHLIARQNAAVRGDSKQLAGERPVESAENGQWAELLGEVVDRFYEVRFGAGTLDKLESEAIEHALTRLEQALAGFSSR